MKKEIVFFLFLLSLTFISAQTISYSGERQVGWKVLSQTSIEQAYDVKISGNTICATSKESTYTFDSVIVSKEWYEKVIDKVTLWDEYESTKTLTDYVYTIPDTLPVKTSKDFLFGDSLEKVVDKDTGEISFCYEAEGDEEWIKLGENSVYIVPESEVFTNARTTNITTEANFSHLELIGDTSNPLRGFNLTPRNSSLPYFEDDDNSYAYFDGVDDYIRIPASQSFNMSSATLGAWIKPSTDSASGTILDVNNYDELPSSEGILISIVGFEPERFYCIHGNGTDDSDTEYTTAFDFNSNVWYYVACTYDGVTSNKTWWVNGNPVRSIISGTPGPIVYESDDVLIGRRLVASFNYWSGGIDNVRIFNSSLSQENMSAIYNAGRKAIDSNYSSEVSRYLFDDSSLLNATDELDLNNGSFESSTGYGYDSKGLISYWNFDADDNVTAYDFSGNNNDGVYSGDVVTIGGMYSNSANFSGVNGIINISDSNSLSDTGNEMTISMWCKTTGACVLWKKEGNFKTNGYALNYAPISSVFDFYGEDNSGSSYERASVTNDGLWHHVVASVNLSASNKVILYKDGVALSSISSFSGSLTRTSKPLLLGWRDIGYQNGTIDEVMIFNHALNSTEILAIYNNQSSRYKNPGEQIVPQFNISVGANQVNVFSNGSQMNEETNISLRLGRWDVSLGYNNSDLNSTANGLVAYWHLDGDYLDYSGNGNNGTGSGNPTNTSAGRFGSGVEFDGVNDKIEVTDNVIYSTGTISVWGYKKSTAEQYIFGQQETGDRFYLRSGTGGIDDVMWLGLAETANINTGYNMPENEWIYFTLVWGNSSHSYTFYVNGINKSSGSYSGDVKGGGDNFPIGVHETVGNYWNGSIDEVMMFNRSLSAEEVKELYVKGRALWNYTEPQNLTEQSSGNFLNTFEMSTATTNLLPEFSLISNAYNWYSPILKTSFDLVFDTADLINPSVIWNNQTPQDINTTNVVGTKNLTITYNITDYNLNVSTIDLYFKSNSSLTNIQYYQNGTPHSGFFAYLPSTSSDSTYYWNLKDNEIFPATYNYGEITMENTPHLIKTDVSSSKLLKIEFLNVSNTQPYSFFEIMANSTPTAGNLRFWYCNSSYTNGLPSVNDNCHNFYTLQPTQNFTHTHTQYSSHQVIPMAINNLTGTIDGVYVTSTSYIILQNGATDGWSVYYIANQSRSTTTATSDNGGNSWTPQTYTVDSHIHQFNGYTFWYYACANDTYGNQNCSDLKYDLVEQGGLPPSGLEVLTPTNQTYAGFLNITYTSATSVNGYDMTKYNITLRNPDGTYNATITANNGLNLSYYWDTTSVSDGSYKIRVTVYDELNQSSIASSDVFTIDNTAPIITIYEPKEELEEVYSGTSFPLSVGANTLVDTWWYSIDTNSSLNITFTPNITISNFYYTGMHKITVWANDSLNNVGSANVDFEFIYVPAGNISRCPINKFGYNNPYLPQLKNPECS